MMITAAVKLRMYDRVVVIATALQCYDSYGSTIMSTFLPPNLFKARVTVRVAS